MMRAQTPKEGPMPLTSDDVFAMLSTDKETFALIAREYSTRFAAARRSRASTVS